MMKIPGTILDTVLIGGKSGFCQNNTIFSQNGSKLLINKSFNFFQIGFDTHLHTNVRNLRLIRANVN